MWQSIVDNFFNLFHTGKYLQVLLFIAGLMILRSFWNLQKNEDIDLDFLDLLIGPDGKASGSKIMQLGAFAISTWAFVYLVIKDNLSEWYYTTYMIAWSGSHLISKWISEKSQEPMYPRRGRNYREEQVRIPPAAQEEGD